MATVYVQTAREYHKCAELHNGLVDDIEKRQQKELDKGKK